MRESCTYGSVRGARGNSRPYRDRREFITLLGGAAAWPVDACAQQSVGKLPRIGAIHSVRSENFEAFEQGLREAEYVAGRNVLLETRFPGIARDRLDGVARQLVALKCDVPAPFGASGGQSARCRSRAARV